MANLPKVAVLVLNWNGEKDSLNCIVALNNQTFRHTVIAVDNASEDKFAEKITSTYKKVVLLQNTLNRGFAGGVNTGIRYALSQGFDYVALINNDALPDPNWLKELYDPAKDLNRVGIVTGKLLKTDGTIDSTGDQYTIWGLAFPRGRSEKDNGQYDAQEEVFGATGGASLYRVSMLKEIGLFDEDFFAYYEDVDLSFRAQLAGWKVIYAPKAVAYHKIGASSSKVPGLTTYMTIKNLPWLFWKNVPLRLIPKLLPRFSLAYLSLIVSSLAQGRLIPILKGIALSSFLLPKKIVERHHIQHSRVVSTKYINSILVQDLPPNAEKLRKLREVLHIYK